MEPLADLRKFWNNRNDEISKKGNSPHRKDRLNHVVCLEFNSIARLWP